MFNHTFSHDMVIYATPYSTCGYDFMDGATAVCSADCWTISSARLVHLLNEILFYSGMCKDEQQFRHYRSHCIRRLYSLEVRLQKAVGQYACRNILETLHALQLVKVEPW